MAKHDKTDYPQYNRMFRIPEATHLCVVRIARVGMKPVADGSGHKT
jgi:hypothetical protein